MVLKRLDRDGITVNDVQKAANALYNMRGADGSAGGGSIAWLDPAGGLQVGPRSAGADPGPACYGRGGVEPTVTDANVVLGTIPAGPVADGQITISRELAEAAIALWRAASP